MKFKVGDKVRIRKDLELNKKYSNITFIDDMKEYLGCVTTIKKVNHCAKHNNYDLEIDDGYLYWGEDMLEAYIEDLDKDKFLNWLEDKINKITYETSEKHLNNEVKRQLWRGFILSMQEIKAQVESGKFDKK